MDFTTIVEHPLSCNDLAHPNNSRISKLSNFRRVKAFKFVVTFPVSRHLCTTCFVCKLHDEPPTELWCSVQVYLTYNA